MTPSSNYVFIDSGFAKVSSTPFDTKYQSNPYYSMSEDLNDGEQTQAPSVLN